jgi:hypothetical protein
MVFRMIMVFGISAALYMGLVRAFQASAHFGWSSRRLWATWLIVVISTVVLSAIGYINATQLPPQRVVAAIALGIIVGFVLLATRKPNWVTTRSDRN